MLKGKKQMIYLHLGLVAGALFYPLSGLFEALAFASVFLASSFYMLIASIFIGINQVQLSKEVNLENVWQSTLVQVIGVVTLFTSPDPIIIMSAMYCVPWLIISVINSSIVTLYKFDIIDYHTK